MAGTLKASGFTQDQTPTGVVQIVSHRLQKLALFLIAIATISASNLLADLQLDIKRILADRALAKTLTGVEVVRLTQQPSNCQVLFERNSHTLLTPASNLKILTTSAALEVLTPQFHFRTLLVKHGDDLVIWGDGDPTFGDAVLMDQIGWTQTAVFDDWAGQLAKRGITNIRNVIVDDSIFDDQFLHPRWEQQQFQPSGAQVGGLNFSLNTIDFTIQDRKGNVAAWSTRPATAYVRVLNNTCVGNHSTNIILARNPGSNDFSLKGSVDGTWEGPTTIHDPSMYAGTVFADVIRAHGAKMTGTVLRDRTTRAQYAAAAADPTARDQQWQVMCIFETPLPNAIQRCNKESVNIYAEAFCKRLGATLTGSDGSWKTGTQVVGDFLRNLGIPANEYNLDDGSGLSHDNEVTVNAIIHCLLHNYYSGNRRSFMDSLPIGGVDGTLSKRFDSPVRGRVFAKTGYIKTVSALSGYLKTEGGEWYAFSILMNGVTDLTSARIAQEKIVEAIDEAASSK